MPYDSAVHYFLLQIEELNSKAAIEQREMEQKHIQVQQKVSKRSPQSLVEVRL